MKTKSTNHKKNNNLMYIAIGVAIIAIAVVKFLPSKNVSNTNTPSNSVNTTEEASDATNENETNLESANVVDVTINEDDNIVIPLADITEDATFYSYDNDGLDMEVIAIKASDGSIRTAFNTCQVCFGSGRAYYKQEGDKLVCQNCGNQFTADDVELIKGGCNPVPISAEEKDVTDSEILISKAYLDSNKGIFENWQR